MTPKMIALIVMAIAALVTGIAILIIIKKCMLAIILGIMALGIAAAAYYFYKYF